jgi:hypothetical protein
MTTEDFPNAGEPPADPSVEEVLECLVSAAESGRRVYYGTLADLIRSAEEAQAGQAHAADEDPHLPLAAGGG